MKSLALTPHVTMDEHANRNNYIPLVSIGLPVYNGGKYLAEAIESILNQDFKDFELIISDNNSSDQTREICERYEKSDNRVRYVRLSENLGAGKNFLNVLALSRSPYFMWASHDDLHEKTFIRKCLEKIQTDESIVLVYPRTKLLNSDSKYLGIANDHVKADQEDPAERFCHLMCEIKLCNMFYGLFRSDAVKKAKSWGKTLFEDNLFLAEMSFAGKIIQIPEPLFIRRFTRDYNYRSPDERNLQLISSVDPSLLGQGISLPHCRLTYAHLDLVHNFNIKKSLKEILMKEVIKCFKTRFGNQMRYEIDRAINLISQGICYWTWRNDRSEAALFSDVSALGNYRISNLLKRLQEALMIYPERSDLFQCYLKCIQNLTSSGNTSGTISDC